MNGIVIPDVVDGLVVVNDRIHNLRIPPEFLFLHPAIEAVAPSHLDGRDREEHWLALRQEARRLREMMALRRQLIDQASDPSILCATLHIPIRTVEEAVEYMELLADVGDSVFEVTRASFVFRLRDLAVQLLVTGDLADLASNASLVPTTVISTSDMQRVVGYYR